jgi:hypothetical protein
MTSIPNRSFLEHLSKLNYCVSISKVRTVPIPNRALYVNYPFVNNQKLPGAILNFLLLFRNLNNGEYNTGNDTENTCCHAGFDENDIIVNNKIRYIISNVKDIDERASYDFKYDLIRYNTIYNITQGNVANGTYIFIPESYIGYLSTEYPNRTGMIVKLQVHTYSGSSKPLQSIIETSALPNHMLVLACIALQSGYPKPFEIMDGNNIEIVDLAYMPILCSVDEQLIKDVMYSHGFVLEFSLPIEFEVRDVERVRVIRYDHVLLGNAYFASSGGPAANYLAQPYRTIRFLNRA